MPSVGHAIEVNPVSTARVESNNDQPTQETTKKSKKVYNDKSLIVLTQKFLYLYLSGQREVPLDTAAKKMLTTQPSTSVRFMNHLFRQVILCTFLSCAATAMAVRRPIS